MVKGGLIVASVIGASAVGISALALPFVSPAFRRVCIPFVPASDVQINNVKRLLSLVPRPVCPIIDLGSGDGRVVFECAKLGHQAVGVELNRPLVIYSKLAARKQRLSNKAKFFRRDIFKTDLSPYRTAILFGAESMVDMLVPKLDEMNEESHLIMCRFPMVPGTRWKLLHSEGSGIDEAWLYQKSRDVVDVVTDS